MLPKMGAPGITGARRGACTSAVVVTPASIASPSRGDSGIAACQAGNAARVRSDDVGRRSREAHDTDAPQKANDGPGRIDLEPARAEVGRHGAGVVVVLK